MSGEWTILSNVICSVKLPYFGLPSVILEHPKSGKLL